MLTRLFPVLFSLVNVAPALAGDVEDLTPTLMAECPIRRSFELAQAAAGAQIPGPQLGLAYFRVARGYPYADFYFHSMDFHAQRYVEVNCARGLYEIGGWDYLTPQAVPVLADVSDLIDPAAALARAQVLLPGQRFNYMQLEVRVAGPRLLLGQDWGRRHPVVIFDFSQGTVQVRRWNEVLKQFVIDREEPIRS